MRRLTHLWIATLFIKLLFAGVVPLAPDEAYYWVWSHHPQLSYYDHPPFVAWLLWLGQPFELLGSLVRWPAVVFGHLAYWFWLPLFSRFLNDRALLIWSLLWLLHPLTGPGSLITTPDLPLMVLVPAALLALLKTLETKSLRWAACFGLALGLGFCAKYHMALFGLLCLVWLIFDKKFSRDLWPAVTVSVFTFLIFSLPVWVWNYQNDFASFRFQMGHGLGATEWQAFWTWSYVLGQFLLVFPVIFLEALKNHRLPSTPTWLKIFAWGPLLFFFVTSFKGKVEANWPILAYPFVLALAAMTLTRGKLVVASSLWTFAAIFVAADLTFGLLPLESNPLKTREIRELNLLAESTRDSRPIYAHSYQMAAKMSFELKEPIAKLRGSGRLDFYDRLEESRPQAPKYYFITRTNYGLPAEFAETHEILTRRVLDYQYDLLEVQAP